jgi:hypothetical protein
MRQLMMTVAALVAFGAMVVTAQAESLGGEPTRKCFNYSTGQATWGPCPSSARSVGCLKQKCGSRASWLEIPYSRRIAILNLYWRDCANELGWSFDPRGAGAFPAWYTCLVRKAKLAPKTSGG